MIASAETADCIPSAPWGPAAPPPGFHENPYPHYRALREATPIARGEDGSLLLTRYADVAAVYRDVEIFSSDKRAEFAPKYGDTPLFEHHTTSLVFNDDPYHGRVRRRLVGALTPRAISGLGASLSEYCDTLTARLAGHGVCDALEGFASAIPVRVIGDMFDVPEGDREPLRGWSLAILGALEPAPDADVQRRGNAAVREFSLFLEDLIAERRVRPGDPDCDLLTRLVMNGDAQDVLSGRELVHNAIFLLNAGHETTTNLIGNALHILAQDIDLQRALAEAPDLVPGFVEEVLRFESPNQLGNRRTVRDTVVGGFPVRAGTGITLMIGAANRDPAAFDAPDSFDVRRKPNRHLAFGAGGHQCAGLSLARLEGVVAIGAWLRRFSAFALAEPVAWQRRVRFRGLKGLRLSLGNPRYINGNG